MYVQRLPFNEKGRDFVVGDIHGCFSLVETALQRVDFQPECDRLISVGDLINRGPESEKSLSYLQQEWFHAVRGNHEEMYLRIFEGEEIDEFELGFQICSEKVGASWLKSIPDAERVRYRDLFEKLPYLIEVETRMGLVGIVHAEIPLSTTWQEFVDGVKTQDESYLYSATWGRSRFNQHDQGWVQGVSRVFHGHTPQTQGPVQFGNRFYVDTGAVYYSGAKNMPGLFLGNILASDETIKNVQYDGFIATIP